MSTINLAVIGGSFVGRGVPAVLLDGAHGQERRAVPALRNGPDSEWRRAHGRLCSSTWLRGAGSKAGNTPFRFSLQTDHHDASS
ncbi:hypothetical protein [Rhodanobacter denitrificans]|uniref:hypothetical protein n=1 Tax=Rhodanobacter denitrificans TaxID=666685 RepID=UPI0011C01BBD|nr:hypothetical protein [Rhodanobacter denitrificans]